MTIVDIRLGKWQDALATVPDASVRLILTSPPYDNARTYEGTNEPVDFGELAAFALRVLMPGGTLAMVLDAPMKDGVQSVTPYRVICEWAALDGWEFRQLLAYGRGSVPGNTVGWFRRDHEPFLVFVKGGSVQVCEKDRICERGSYNKPGKGGRRASGNERRGQTPGTPTKIHRGSVWWYGAAGAHFGADAGHPATFAEAFAADAVNVWSNPGDLVCDPFTGSGTVAKACRDLGRSFVGAERVPIYHEMALRRLDPTHVSAERAAEPCGALFEPRVAR